MYHIICPSAFCCWCHSYSHLEDEHSRVLEAISSWLRTNARFCIWITRHRIFWPPRSSSRVSPARKCWVCVSVTVSGEMTSVDMEGEKRGGLLPWLWQWPFPLLCLQQVGGWSSFHQGRAYDPTVAHILDDSSLLCSSIQLWRMWFARMIG